MVERQSQPGVIIDTYPDITPDKIDEIRLKVRRTAIPSGFVEEYWDGSNNFEIVYNSRDFTAQTTRYSTA